MKPMLRDADEYSSITEKTEKKKMKLTYEKKEE